MPLQIKDDAPKSFPNPDTLTLANFKRGVITLIDRSRLPKDALEAADNIFLYEDGQPGPRPGVDWYGTAPTTTVTTSYTVPASAAGTSWTNPTNVYASDDARAVFATTTQLDLKITNFSFNIPTTATILGVTISVEGNGTDATAANRSVELGLTKDGTTLSGTRAASQQLNQTTDTTLTFGSASSMFGTTLTPAEVNLSTFGILLRAANANAGARNIDQVMVKITYTNNFSIDGFDYFDFAGAIHLVMVTGGYVHRSTDDGTTWTQCTGATLTSGITTNMNQYNNYLYLTNGTDAMTRYDGSTTLQVYTTLSTPAAPTIVETGTGLTSGTNYQYYYKTSSVNSIGFSIASPASTVIQTGLAREDWTAGTNYATLTIPAFAGTQTRADIYISEDNLNFYYLSSTTTTTFVDDGSAIVNSAVTAPTGNTSTGPRVAELANVGSRMYGVRDTDNRYRIWFTSGTAPKGAFASAYDGGYLDWQEGGKYLPVKVVDYRDGKGTPLATIFCDSADGQGCILQMSLDTLTVGDISITVPSAYKLPGSRGTPSPDSVVNVLNDFMFYNSQAFYNLGSRAQFLNLLSTDEISANIRPTVKTISSAGESMIASAYFDGKVYFSVALSSDTPNYVTVYDTERKAWLPKAFTMGFKKFLRYTDTGGIKRLLAIKDGDTKLSEISTDILGDYGSAFQTSLITGLYPVSKDRFEFQWVEEGEFELSNSRGDIQVSLIGIHRTQGFSTIKSVELTDVSVTVSAGWDTFGWDTTVCDDTSVVATTFSESSVKRYFIVQKELNAVQWQITTSSLSAYYVLRTLQTWGTPTQAGHPKQWRLR